MVAMVRPDIGGLQGTFEDERTKGNSNVEEQKQLCESRVEGRVAKLMGGLSSRDYCSLYDTIVKIIVRGLTSPGKKEHLAIVSFQLHAENASIDYSRVYKNAQKMKKHLARSIAHKSDVLC